MATGKLTKKDVKQDEFIEGMFDFGEWLELHWRRVAMALGAVVALVLAGVWWNAMRERSAVEANSLLASGMEAFAPTAGAAGAAAPPRYTEALALFAQAADRGGSREIGDVARLFHARTLLELSRGPEAVPELEALVAGGNKALDAEAKVVLATALEAAGNAERAATILQELTVAGKSAYPQDAALLLLAGVRERQGKKEDAKRVYAELLSRYPQSPFAADAKQRTAKL